MAPIIRRSPGALSEYHGEALMLSVQAPANPKSAPADTAEKKTLSGLMLPFLTPARETSSMVSCGV